MIKNPHGGKNSGIHVTYKHDHNLYGRLVYNMGFFDIFKNEIKTEILELDNIKFQVKIHYENRRNSRASIGARAVHIRIPVFLSPKQKLKEELKLKSWVERKLRENIHKYKIQQPKEYKNNDIIKISDKEYILKISFKNKRSSSGRLINNEIHLSVSSNLSKIRQNKHISKLLSRVIGRERLPKLQKRIITLNQEYFHQNINKISFKNQKTRWGSCSGKGNINISTRLLFAPDDVLEYVCIHELAHLKEMNHSKRFWKLVGDAMPDYKEKLKWLKENGGKCSF